MAGEKWAFSESERLLVWVGDGKGCDMPPTRRKKWPLRGARHELDPRTLACIKCGTKPRLSAFARRYLGMARVPSV